MKYIDNLSILFTVTRSHSLLDNNYNQNMEFVPVRLLCPFGRNDKNLVVSDLKASEKTWLVNEVKHFGVSYQDLNNAYGFKPSYMIGLASKFKKNGVLYDKSGRTNFSHWIIYMNTFNEFPWRIG
jgi:hypothetical protein